MSRTAEQEQIFKQERTAGKKAAKMAQDYLLAVIKQRVHIRNIGNPDPPILKATKVKPAMGDYRLLGLNLSSSKTAFILNYGFTGIREATAVYFNDGRYNIGKTQRERHAVDMKERDFFSNIYDNSGAVDFLIAQLSQTRTAAYQLKLDGMVRTFNSQSNG